jgi:hypothetical protein|tara:strand:- start:104 stop:268 length:165 start_codon:yes stop_codon:yes gene_type:complete
MRSKETILKDGATKDSLILEVLLDIREDVVPKEVLAPLYISNKPPKERKKRTPK